MAKLTKQEFIEKYKDKIEDQELSIELIEDISDSMSEDAVDAESIKTELEAAKASAEEYKAKYDDLAEKYKARFLSSEEVIEEKTEEKIDEPEEEKLIDIKEI